MDQQTHTMELKTTYSDQSELWFCPTCGRQMVITWNPWNKDVINEGDSFAIHSGGKGGVQMGSVIILDKSLDPFNEWAEWYGL